MILPRIAVPVAIVLALVGCSKHDETSVSSKVQVPAVTGIAVEPVRAETIPDVEEAVGTVKSRRQMILSSKVVATVTAIRPREGDRVRAGEVLVELDDRDLRAGLDRAQAGAREARDALDETGQAIQAADSAIDAAAAQSDLASATLRRYAMLLDRGSVSRQEHDEVLARAKGASAELARARQQRAALVAKQRQARARIAQADAEVANARIALSYARITAPTDGVVVARTAEPGNLAAPGTPLLTIDEPRYRLELAVPETDVGKLRIGQRGTVTIDAVGRHFDAPITEIVPAADAQSRTFTVKVDLPPSPDLRTGLYGAARFPVGHRTALVLPRTAVGERGQLERVFVVDGGNVAHMRLVTTGKTYGESVEILSGLTAGERVAVAGGDRLLDGSRVETAR